MATVKPKKLRSSMTLERKEGIQKAYWAWTDAEAGMKALKSRMQYVAFGAAFLADSSRRRPL